ncbi:hypothetical protein GCM10022257_16180 [Hyunsoonleella aestuarii]|uniref:Uncharacterized protein n=1 Tax=Hyunsoonleella aestuarii TaxID=912802 RepID=A0ABP8EBA2_9FLAO
MSLSSLEVIVFEKSTTSLNFLEGFLLCEELHEATKINVENSNSVLFIIRLNIGAILRKLRLKKDLF